MTTLQKATVVYLAGGMRSGWQDQIKKALAGQGFIFIDPRDHGCKDENGYTAWDLSGVSLADVVLGYLEKDNPSGAGLAVEFGWAAKEGKYLVFMEDQGEHPHTRYFGMVRAISNTWFKVTPSTLAEKAAEALRAFREQYPKQLV